MGEFIDPTPDEMRAYVQWLKKTHYVTVTQKADAAEMELVGQWLEGLGILDAGEFLDNFATTIGSVVYVPWEPGEGDTWHQMSLLTHELQHVHQYRQGSTGYLVGYLGSPAKRAHYEADAYATSLELHYTRYGDIPSGAPKQLGKHLTSYGVSGTDVEVTIRELEAVARSLVAGPGYRDRPVRDRWATEQTLKWVRKNAPEIVGRFG